MDKQTTSNIPPSKQANGESDDIFAELARISRGDESALAPAVVEASALSSDFRASTLARPPASGPIEGIIAEDMSNDTQVFVEENAPEPVKKVFQTAPMEPDPEDITGKTVESIVADQSSSFDLSLTPDPVEEVMTEATVEAVEEIAVVPSQEFAADQGIAPEQPVAPEVIAEPVSYGNEIDYPAPSGEAAASFGSPENEMPAASGNDAAIPASEFSDIASFEGSVTPDLTAAPEATLNEVARSIDDSISEAIEAIEPVDLIAKDPFSVSKIGDSLGEPIEGADVDLSVSSRASAPINDGFNFDFDLGDPAAPESVAADESLLVEDVTVATLEQGAAEQLADVTPAFNENSEAGELQAVVSQHMQDGVQYPVQSTGQDLGQDAVTGVAEELSQEFASLTETSQEPVNPVLAEESVDTLDVLASQFENSYETVSAADETGDIQNIDFAAAAAAPDFVEPSSVQLHEDLQNELQGDFSTQNSDPVAASSTIDALESFINGSDNGSVVDGQPVSPAASQNYFRDEGLAAATPLPESPVSAHTDVLEPSAQSPIHQQEPAKRGILTSFWLPALGGVVLIALAGGAYWTLGPGEKADVIAPVIEAQNTVVKLPPVEKVTTPEAEVSAPDPSKVIDDIINEAAEIATGENLVVTNNVRPVTELQPVDSLGTLTNRKVRTVTVRPDGTIVSRNEGATNTVEPLPTIRPNVPTLPDAQPPAAAGQTDVATATPVEGVTPQIPLETTVIETSPIAGVIENSTIPLEPAVDSVKPVLKPENLVALAPPAPITPVATATPTPITVSNSNSSHVVQLSSQRTQEIASRSLSSFQRRFSGILNDSNLEIVQADLGAKGIYYRVVAPANSANEGNALCTSIKNAGGDCYVRRR